VGVCAEEKFGKNKPKAIIGNSTLMDDKEEPIVYVFQSLKSQQLDGTKISTVVVHQHLLSGKLDMRVSLVLH
jgi:hypothetical protein